jgi:putative ABC transport system permease protein
MRHTILALSLAIRNLLLHKLRSLLTVLGLIFGVASVVAMLAIAEGASLEAQRQIASLGATNIIVKSVKPVDDQPRTQGADQSFVLAYGLTHEDYDRISQTVPTVVAALPLREFRKKVRHLENELEARIVGSVPQALKLSGLHLAQGRFLSDTDLERYDNVCVIGAEVAKKLFPFGDPVGKAVRIDEGYYYRVVGVVAHKDPTGGAGSSLESQDFNKDVYIPLTTDRVRFGELLFTEKQGSLGAERLQLSQITVSVDSMDNVKRTADAIESLLAQHHERKDYAKVVPLDLLEKAEATKRIFNMVLGSIASISLVVGGIGIMNIMLATVTERTREIGIRRALGAKRRDIIYQFLVETALLSAAGAAIGVALGLAAPPVVARLSGMPVVIRAWSPVLAFLIAVGIGVVFGVYPARRAARMDPVEALRAE